MDVSNVFERRSLNKNFEEKKRNGIKRKLAQELRTLSRRTEEI